MKDLTIEEQNEINGGIFGIDDYIIGVAVGVTVAAATEIINDWEHFKQGLAGK